MISNACIFNCICKCGSIDVNYKRILPNKYIISDFRYREKRESKGQKYMMTSVVEIENFNTI